MPGVPPQGFRQAAGLHFCPCFIMWPPVLFRVPGPLSREEKASFAPGPAELGIASQKSSKFSRLRQFPSCHDLCSSCQKRSTVTKRVSGPWQGPGLSSALDFGIIRGLNRQKRSIILRTIEKSISIFPAFATTGKRRSVPHFASACFSIAFCRPPWFSGSATVPPIRRLVAFSFEDRTLYPPQA